MRIQMFIQRDVLYTEICGCIRASVLTSLGTNNLAAVKGHICFAKVLWLIFNNLQTF